jgi:L-fuconolactonase
VTRSPLLDAHAHFWHPSLHRYEWLDGEPELNRPFLPSGVVRRPGESSTYVFVQADCRPEEGFSEARWADSLAERWPEIRGIVAFAPLEKGARVAADLERLREMPRVVGVRRLLQSEDERFFRSPSLHAGLDAVATAGLTFDACVPHVQLGALLHLLRRHPELPVVLDHLGKPPLGDGIQSEAGTDWATNIRLLAELPNVYVKLSGLPAEVPSSSYDASGFRPWLLTALEAFGSSRAMAGSDWPVSAHAATRVGYDEWFELVLGSLGLSGSQREDVGWRTASAFYGLESVS